MPAAEYVTEIAVPTVLEFFEEPTRRRAYLACMVSYHTGDYLAQKGRNQGDIAEAMEADIGVAFTVLQLVCNAAKHRRTGLRGKVAMVSGADTERAPSGFDESPWDEFRFDDNGGRVVRWKGHDFDLLDLCVIALKGYARLYDEDIPEAAVAGLSYNPGQYPKEITDAAS